MRAPFGPVLVLALLCVPSIAAARHQSSRLELGDRVRLKLAAVRRAPIVGTISGLSDSQLTVSPYGAGRSEENFAWASGVRRGDETFAWAELARVERHDGKRSHVLLGALLGMTAGFVVAGITSPSDRSVFGLEESVGKAALGLGAGLFAGGVAGAFIRSEKWRKISVDSRRGFRPEPDQIPPSGGIANRAQAANWTLGFSAGTGIPMGDSRGNTNLGFIGGVDLDYWTTEKVAVGLDGSFISNNSSDDWEAAVSAQIGTPVTSNTTMLQGGAHLKCKVSETRISPYVLAGLGAYRVRDRHESLDPYYDSDGSFHSYLGTRAGLGLMYRASDTVAIGIEGAFHGVWTSWGEAWEFISVQAGMSIGMGDPAE